MPLTYKKIAELAGVSRGTVDRVLNNRGRVSPEVKKKIMELARQNQFVPNQAGKALAKARNPVKIGVVIHLTQIPFFSQVLEGINKAAAEIKGLGGEILVSEIPTMDGEAHVKAVEGLLEQGVHGLCISPVEDAALRDYLNEERRERGIPIVTFNTDMTGLEHMCFVGLDNMRSGRTAAGLMNMLFAGGRGKTLIISGFAVNRANSQRLDGFIEETADKYPNLEIVGIQFNADDEQSAYKITLSALEDHPDLAGIYMIAAGQAGVCRALEQTGTARKIKVIVHDMLPETVEYINNGVIDFIIDQNAFEQGYLSARILYNYLFDGKTPECDNFFTDISIKTMYNI